MEKITQMTKKMNRNIRVKQLLFVIGILGGIIVLLLQFSKVKKIEVNGNVRYSNQEIIDMLNIGIGDNTINVLLDNKNANETLLYLKEANIKYSGLNKITINIEEKDIIGYIPYMNKYLCIDYEGYIIDYTVDRLKNIPVIEGIEIKDFKVSEKLDVNYKVIEAFVMFHSMQKEYALNIKSIKVKNNDINDIVLMIDSVQVFFGSPDRSSDKIKVIGEIMKNIEPNMAGSMDLSGNLNKVIFKKSK